MESLIPDLVRRTRAEAIYTYERQRVNRERFRDYCEDFQAACHQGDYRRIHEVVRDATMITSDMIRLVGKMATIRVRWRSLNCAMQEERFRLDDRCDTMGALISKSERSS